MLAVRKAAIDITMGIFDRTPDSDSSRSAQERERARIEREARRAGIDPPQDPQAPQEPQEPQDPQEPQEPHEPQEPQEPQPQEDEAIPEAIPLANPSANAPIEEQFVEVHDEWEDDPEWVEPELPPLPPPPKHRGRAHRAPVTAKSGGRTRKYIARIAAVGALILVIGGLWFANELFQPFKSDSPSSSTVTVKVARGSSVDAVANQLASQGVISSAFFFKLRAKISGKQEEFKPGVYQLPTDMSYDAAITALSKGPPPAKTEKYTITEGRTRQQVNRLLKKTDLKGSYLAATRTSKILTPQQYGAPKRIKNLEGFLFPATYDIRVGATVQALVDQQLVTFKNRFSKIDLAKAKKKNLTGFDIVTIASMIEEEVTVDSERPLVAAVIYNRLKAGMTLGIDATVRFAVNNYDQPLKVSELETDSPYNTRKFPGLPPGPISSPGEASLYAAANPAKVSYLYYVVKPGTCYHQSFSTTNEQFQRDVAAYDAARAKAGGKSPVKCP